MNLSTFPAKKGIALPIVAGLLILVILIAISIVTLVTNVMGPKATTTPEATTSPTTAPDITPTAVPTMYIECEEPCDDGNPCTRDFCNTTWGVCDHEWVCCGNGICEENEDEVSCPEDCKKERDVNLSVNLPPEDWCEPDEPIPMTPYISSITPESSDSTASIKIEIINPMDVPAKNVEIELYISKGYNLLTGTNPMRLPDIPPHELASSEWTFTKEAGAPLERNPTWIKLAYSFDSEQVTICTETSFNPEER